MSDAPIVVFEGIDGSGKDTVIDMLKMLFSEYQFKREPTHYRDIIFSDSSTEITSYMHFMADRSLSTQHMQTVQSQEDVPIICNRYIGSTYAYQLESLDYDAVGHDLYSFIETTNKPFPKPDLVIYLDVPVEQALERRGEPEDKYERTEYLKKVRENYTQLEEDTDTWTYVDSSRSKSDVAFEVLDILKTYYPNYF